MIKSDVDARVLDYFHLCNAIVKNNGLAALFALFSEEDGAKKKCKILLNCLPEELTTRVKNEIDFRLPTAKSNVSVLFKVVSEKALEIDRGDLVLPRNKRRPRTLEAKQEMTSRPLKRARILNENDKSRQLQSQTTQRTIFRTSSNETRPGPKGGCWTCGGRHLQADCPEKLDDTEYTTTRTKNKGGTAKLKRISVCLPDQPGQPRMLRVSGVMDVAYHADSGAETSCISSTALKKINEQGVTNEVAELTTPIECKLPGGKKTLARAVTKLKLSLMTAAGPVNIIKPVSCLTLECEEAEVLLGDDVLKQQELELLAAPSNEDGDDDDDIPDVEVNKDEEAIRLAVEAMIQLALDEGFPAGKIERLRTIVYAYDVWRLTLGSDPPAKVEPMRIRMKAGCKPFRAKARKYAPEYQAFLESFNDKLVSLGWVYENPSRRRACAALLVRKSGGSDFRQTVDYKPSNSQTEPIAGIMPNLHVDLEKVRGSRHFGLFDFIKGYWQLPLAKECQELLSYLTHRKIYTPRRVPQGSADAALYFQSTIERCYQALLYTHVLIWIDDLLLYAADIDTHLDKLQELLELTAKFGFKLSVVKSCVYKQEVKWCGKVINGEGVTHDSGRIEALQNMPYPTNAGELQQFICSTNWMRDSIVDYARLAHPLQDTLDTTMAQVSRRTKRVASGLPVALTVQECAAYNAVKQALANSATLAFPKPEAETILLTDASDVGWSVNCDAIEELQAAQPRHIVDRPQGLTQSRVVLWCSDDRIWIPSNEESLVQRLLVIGHCGAQGHRGRDALVNIVNRRFLIRNFSAMVKTFLVSCHMCQHVKGGKIVMRPWAETFRCNERNGALHWDYVQLGNSLSDYKYLLVLKDDAIHFCELVPCAVPTAAVTAEAILDWHSRYGAPRVWISDQGSHFKNLVMAEVARRLTSGQRFTVAYSPWINGQLKG
ncbi:Putative retroelement [Phytophthora palmivora]|uniref:Retroelement n=1 Tax=Phytophthora palmivora TaxID=4796 RepID=A0A2P4Y985_9STRA|nr:Putative retroelement [Phytophthora palmivora]